MSFIPKFEDIEAALRLIRPYVHRTPVLTSRQLDIISGAKLFFKCENFQKTGAFKFRGATNACRISRRPVCRRVVDALVGNHAAAPRSCGIDARGEGLYLMPPPRPGEEEGVAAMVRRSLLEPTCGTGGAAGSIERTGATMFIPMTTLHHRRSGYCGNEAG